MGLLIYPEEAAALRQQFAGWELTDPPGFVKGGDCNYFLNIFAFIRRLLREGRFLPAMAKHTNAANVWYNAEWRPYLEDAPDALAELAALMPESFAHVREYPDGSCIYRRPDKKLLLTSLINALTDAMVKQELAESKAGTPAAEGAAANSPRSSLLKSFIDGNSWWNLWLRQLIKDDIWSLPRNPKTDELYTHLSRWWPAGMPPALAAQQKNFRTCFRLEEPPAAPPGPAAPADPAAHAAAADPPSSRWRLNFLVPPIDDASLLLPAAAIWSAAGETFSFLNRQFPNLQQKLLKDLAGAAAIFPPLAACLREPCPFGLDLSVEEAHAFLAEAAGRLQKAGYGVIVPNWWRRRPTPIKIRLQAGDLTENSQAGLRALLNYSLEAVIGDQSLSKSDLENIVAFKTPLVYAAGRWREISPAEASAALSMLRRHEKNKGRLTLSEFLCYSAGAADGGEEYDFDAEDPAGPAVLPQVSIEAPARLKNLLRRLTGQQTLTETAPPPSFRGSLRPYQRRGVAWLSFLRQLGLGACLADDMGLGKTVQVIAYLLHHRKNASGRPASAALSRDLPVLIVCPHSVAGNWQREIARFAPDLKVHFHLGGGRPHGQSFLAAAQTADAVITTYSLLCRDEAELAAIEWDTVILDEAQNIKNPAARQTAAANKLNARCRIALTGTPVENRLSELWSIMHFLNPGYLGGLDEFKRRFADPIERGGDQKKRQVLQRLIRPFLLRRLKTDKAIIRDLPEKQETKIYCPLTREQATLYAAVLEVMLPRLENAPRFARKALIAATLTKLKQVCDHPVLFLRDSSELKGRSGKLARLAEMLEELAGEGRRALVFTQYRQMGELIRQYLEQELSLAVYFLHGGVPQSERDRLIASFQNDAAAPPVFILSLKAGGVGLNLTAADTVFHFDRWWNPAVENQATDRAFRIGQTRNVQVYKFICPGTLEERIDAMIENKKSLAEDIIGAGESWLSKLSAAELRDILALRETEVAVAED